MPKCVPDFPVYGKRPVIDNDWYKTLARDDVSLVDSPIKSFTEKGILTEDGIEHEFDVIIYATGFNTNRFLWPMDVKGSMEASGQGRRGVWPVEVKGRRPGPVNKSEGLEARMAQRLSMKVRGWVLGWHRACQ